MISLEEIRKIINEELSKINFSGSPPELYEPIEYTMSQEGKRLRPLLCLHSCDIFGGNIQDAIYPALGIEMFHNFTLVHDDIMDNAYLRRGKPTVFKKWNANIALLSGDTMFAKAFELVCKTREDKLKQVLEVFTSTSIKVCEGQQLDMNFETRSDVSINEYIEMIRLKTAVLIAACLKVGAIIANASQENINHIYNFGEAIGITFQIQDDWLDAFADENTFGKKIGNDIVTNKKTFLLIKALEIANEQQRELLLSTLNNNKISENEKINTVIEIYNSIDISKHTKDMMKYYYEIAINELDKIKIPNENKIFLKQFADKLMIRKY